MESQTLLQPSSKTNSNGLDIEHGAINRQESQPSSSKIVTNLQMKGVGASILGFLTLLLCLGTTIGASGALKTHHDTSQSLIGVHDEVGGAVAGVSLSALGDEPLAAPRVKEGLDTPVFLHIPKSGGTSVEDILGRIGFNVGYCNPARPYEIREKMRGMEPWHTPPNVIVPNSWAIVRDPYTRAASEFLWQTNWGNKEMFESLNPGYSAHNCEVFQNYVGNSINGLVRGPLAACYRAGRYTIDAMAKCDADASIVGNLGASSHWIPQSVMAASASRVFKLEECFSASEGSCPCPRARGVAQPNILSFLRANYDPRVSFEVVNEWNPKVSKPDLAQCWQDFDPKVLSDFNLAYDADFSAFGYEPYVPKAGVVGSTFRVSELGSNDHQAPTLGEISKTLPEGETLQDNVAPRCGGRYQPIAPSVTASN